MSLQIIKQPNGKYAVFSSICDNFIHINATSEEIIADWQKDGMLDAAAKVPEIISETVFIIAWIALEVWLDTESKSKKLQSLILEIVCNGWKNGEEKNSVNDGSCEEMFNRICDHCGFKERYVVTYYTKGLFGTKKLGTEIMFSRTKQTNIESAERMRIIYAKRNRLSPENVIAVNEDEDLDSSEFSLQNTGSHL